MKRRVTAQALTQTQRQQTSGSPSKPDTLPTWAAHLAARAKIFYRSVRSAVCWCVESSNGVWVPWSFGWVKSENSFGGRQGPYSLASRWMAQSFLTLGSSTLGKQTHGKNSSAQNWGVWRHWAWELDVWPCVPHLSRYASKPAFRCQWFYACVWQAAYALTSARPRQAPSIHSNYPSLCEFKVSLGRVTQAEIIAMNLRLARSLQRRWGRPCKQHTVPSCLRARTKHQNNWSS